MEFLLILMLTVSSYVGSTAIDKRSSSEDFQPWKIPYLPQTIQPTRYDLFLVPNFYNDESVFSGSIHMLFKVVNETNTILVHSKNLDITITNLYICEKEANVTRTFQYEEYWVVQTNESMPVSSSNCENVLALGFNGNLAVPRKESVPNPAFGFYKNSYFNERTRNESWYVATDFSPSSSRTAFPNLDEPQFKAIFNIVIKHWKNFTVLSNADEMDFEDYDEVWRVTNFKESPIMSSYLVSFIVSDFNFKENKLVGGKLNRVWARPDRLDEVDYALNVTPVLENYLHREFDIAYPLEKLDQFALPKFSVPAMESWGLISYQESTLLVNVMKGGDIAKRTSAFTIAHELAHTYFGNLVTCRSWDHVWLEEGLATFYDVRAMTRVYPTLFYKEQHFAERLEKIMNQDATGEANPLVPVLWSPVTNRSLFDDIRYAKGGAIARMVESFMGPELFRSGIKRYLNDNLYKAVETSHLWTALQQELNHTDLNLTEIMMTWVYRTGFPVVVVIPLCSNEFIAIQEPFLTEPSNVNDSRHIWHVPLNYRTKGGNNGLVWVKSTYVTFEIPLNSNDDWIQFNHDASGYYRVNYHPTLWERLAKQLYDDYTVFSEIARWKLLSDAASMAYAQKLSCDRFLSLTRYASNERGVGPWQRISFILNDINRMIANTTIIDRYQRYVLNLTTSLMDEVQVKDSNAFRLLRPPIMWQSCNAGHRGCIANTTRMFKAWLRDSTNAIPKEFRKQAYIIGVANSVLESEWNTVYERFTTTLGEEKYELVSALAYSRNVTILKRLLEYAVDDTLMDEKSSYLALFGIASNPASEGCIFKWLKSNDPSIDIMAKVLHSGTMAELTAHAVRTRDQRQEVLDFLDGYPFMQPKDIPDILAIMDKNIRWMDMNYAGIDNWLKQNAL